MNSKNIRILLAVWCLLASLGLTLSGCGGGGGGTSTSVITMPSITSNPGDLAAPSGSSASFTVVATGSNLTYQWYKGGAIIAGATLSTYTIAAVTSSSAGSYYVVVSNSAGTETSASAILTVSASGGSTVTVG